MILKFVFLLFGLFHFAASSCLNGSFSWQGNCLIFNSTSSGFVNAEFTCQSLGGHLASIHDGFTNAVIGQEASNNFPQSNDFDFWIGLGKLHTQGNWTWIDGTPYDFNEWKQGQPKNATGDDCAALSWINGFWSSQNCFRFKPFVCAILNSSSSTTSPTVTLPSTTPIFTLTATTTLPLVLTSYPSTANCSDGWIYYQPTHSCYGAYTQSEQNWNDSESRCQSFGAHLPSIHSYDELDFLAIQFIVPNYYNVYAAWLGLHTEDDGKTWIYTDGTPFDYENWYPGFPEAYPNFFCGITSILDFNISYFLIDPCEYTYLPTVCKRPYSLN